MSRKANPGVRQLSIKRVPQWLFDALHAAAEATGVSVATYVAAAIREGLDHRLLPMPDDHRRTPEPKPTATPAVARPRTVLRVEAPRGVPGVR